VLLIVIKEQQQTIWTPPNVMGLFSPCIPPISSKPISSKLSNWGTGDLVSCDKVATDHRGPSNIIGNSFDTHSTDMLKTKLSNWST